MTNTDRTSLSKPQQDQHKLVQSDQTLEGLDDSERLVYQLRSVQMNLLKSCIEGFSSEQMDDGHAGIDYINYAATMPMGSAELGIDSLSEFTNYNGSIPTNKVASALKVPGQYTNRLAASIAMLDKYAPQLGLNSTGKVLLLAQFAHESGNFQFFKEIGGAGRSYGQPKGPYGKRYYGRGPIQVTHDYNYKDIYEKAFPQMGLSQYNIYANPDLCETNDVIAIAATLGFLMLNKRVIEAANSGDIRKTTRYINGGQNGLDDRIKKTQQIISALSTT